MKYRLQHSKTIYNYKDAKKIYFSNSSSKYCLFEKKDYSSVSVCHLLSRNPIVVHNKTGLIVYIEKNRS